VGSLTIKRENMNKKLIAVTLLPVFCAYAGENTGPEDIAKAAKAREEWTKEHFAKQGSPVPDGGVTVIPERRMLLGDETKKRRIKEHSDIMKYGYINQALPQTQSLLNFKEIAKNKFTKTNGSNEEGLRHKIEEIERAYPFKGVPVHDITTMLGVAPSVNYVEGQGWSGAMQYFQKDGLGICSYRENNLKFSHGAAIIPEEDVTTEVNGKVTVKTITGKENSGFLYEVDWYDTNYFRELKCADSSYSLDKMSSLLELARIIDNNG
jgi:hypothetical protein